MTRPGYCRCTCSSSFSSPIISPRSASCLACSASAAPSAAGAEASTRRPHRQCRRGPMSVAILVLAQDLAGAGVDVHVPLAAIPVDDLDLVDVAQKATVELEVRDLA